MMRPKRHTPVGPSLPTRGTSGAALLCPAAQRRITQARQRPASASKDHLGSCLGTFRVGNSKASLAGATVDSGNASTSEFIRELRAALPCAGALLAPQSPDPLITHSINWRKEKCMSITSASLSEPQCHICVVCPFLSSLLGTSTHQSGSDFFLITLVAVPLLVAAFMMKLMWEAGTPLQSHSWSCVPPGASKQSDGRSAHLISPTPLVGIMKWSACDSSLGQSSTSSMCPPRKSTRSPFTYKHFSGCVVHLMRTSTVPSASFRAPRGATTLRRWPLVKRMHPSANTAMEQTASARTFSRWSPSAGEEAASAAPGGSSGCDPGHPPFGAMAHAGASTHSGHEPTA
mmetsp:Transcript_119699/g.267150  ORF Transcript_119699/g.267150 Transcript_119699/m.267150 type:complete len:345 (-) Transcript_119699:7-1041(-)